MSTPIRMTAPFGEVVMAIYDEAALHSDNPREVSRLAAAAISQVLRRARRSADDRPRPATPAKEWVLPQQATKQEAAHPGNPFRNLLPVVAFSLARRRLLPLTGPKDGPQDFEQLDRWESEGGGIRPASRDFNARRVS